MKIYIANDCSTNGHFGCQMVMESYRNLFDRHGLIEVSLPGQADLVLVNGEGSLHHGRRRDLLVWPTRYPSVLVNTVYQANPTDDRMKEFLYVSARESSSALQLHRQGIDCAVTPDVIFANLRFSGLFWSPTAKRRVIETDNVCEPDTGISPFVDPAMYLFALQNSVGVCAGRYHAAVACMAMGVPFASWDSNTHKTRGMMWDARLSKFHFATRAEALERVPRSPSPFGGNYATKACSEIGAMMHDISSVLRNS